MRQPFLGGAVLVGLLSALLCGGAQAQMDTCLDGSRTLIPGGPGNAVRSLLHRRRFRSNLLLLR